MSDFSDYGLGRQQSTDPNDANFPMRRALLLQGAPDTGPYPLFRYRYAEGWWGDQGSKPHCVGYGWTHFVEDGPVVYPGSTHPIINPADVYKQAQKIDEWPGENYDGTSVRAGAKVLQRMKLISGYYWAYELETVLRAIGTLGPVVVGTNWYTSMFNPDERGFVTIKGSVAGGHCFIVNGYNRSTKIVRCKNSWGRSWGKRGHFYMTFSDMSRLIAEDGEACIATEVRKV